MSDDIAYIPCSNADGQVKLSTVSKERLGKISSWKEPKKLSWFGKLFHLPGPQELGRSEYDALPMDDFCEPGEYTWTSWRAEVKSLHPVRFFLAQTLWRGLDIAAHRVWYRAKDAFYWTLWKLDRRRQSHIIDLSEFAGKPASEMRYVDPGEAMLIAAFATLVRYKRSTRYVDPLKMWTPEDVAKSDVLLKSVNDYKEIEALYQWWTADRPRILAELKTLEDSYHKCFEQKLGREVRNERRERLNAVERELSAEEQGMLLRLVAIRSALWG